MRSEKGSITLYVIVAMLTLTAMLMAIYMRNANKQMTQLEITKKIKAIYEDYNIDDAYANLTGGIPEILGYERKTDSITIKTLRENGIRVDQNGKEILYYAATLTEVAPGDDEIGNSKEFGKWQISPEIDLSTNQNDSVYLWIKNEDARVSKKMDHPVEKSSQSE